MRLAFDLFDLKGKPQESGTVEEWWAGPDRARVVIDSPSFKRVLPSADTAVIGREAYLVHLLLTYVVHPMLQVPKLDLYLSATAPQSFGQASLSCTSLYTKGYPTDLEYCLDPSGALRLTYVAGVRSDALNNIASAMGSQVAMTHTISYAGRTAIKGRIESIEPFDPDHFTEQLGLIGPPSGGTITEAEPTNDIAPIYPSAARDSDESGAAVLHMRVFPNGKHSAIDTIASTASIFTEAAFDAVDRWIYAPAKRNGVAIESDVTITVTFLPPDKNRRIPWVTIVGEVDR